MAYMPNHAKKNNNNQNLSGSLLCKALVQIVVDQ
jgi:hypothetical protein